MSEIQLAHFAWGETPDRSRIHEVAIRDARIAADARAGDVPVVERSGLLDRLGVARLRYAFAGAPAVTTDPCGCAA
jgi:hypothetical protein